jgi:hypothetical protein
MLNNPQRSRGARRLAVAIIVLAAACFAQAPLSPAAAQQLVQQTVQNELRASEINGPYFRYKLRKVNNTRSQTRELIETPAGMVARTISVDGRELTPAERAQDDARMAKLVNDPAEQKDKFSKQHDDAERVLRIVRELPQGFIYEYDGSDQMHDGPAVRLRFRPNPQYTPSSTETIIFKGAEGQIWIHAGEHRIIRLDGRLTHDVNIGWGLLGHVDKGGHLLLEQSKVTPRDWHITSLIIEATGKALVFKDIIIRQLQFSTDFKPVPNLSVVQAVQLLRSAAANGK